MFCLFFVFMILIASGQDTIRIERKPNIILKSWWPEFNDFPNLKVGKSKVIFTTIPEFKNLPIRDNTISLICSSNYVTIEKSVDKKINF